MRKAKSGSELSYIKYQQTDKHPVGSKQSSGDNDFDTTVDKMLSAKPNK